jgi:hypothetical protein
MGSVPEALHERQVHVCAPRGATGPRSVKHGGQPTHARTCRMADSTGRCMDAGFRVIWCSKQPKKVGMGRACVRTATTSPFGSVAACMTLSSRMGSVL